MSTSQPNRKRTNPPTKPIMGSESPKSEGQRRYLRCPFHMTCNDEPIPGTPSKRTRRIKYEHWNDLNNHLWDKHNIPIRKDITLELWKSLPNTNLEVVTYSKYDDIDKHVLASDSTRIYHPPLTKKLKKKWNLTQINSILKKRKYIEWADEKSQLIFNQTYYQKKKNGVTYYR
jgi:hypothetical protein